MQDSLIRIALFIVLATLTVGQVHAADLTRAKQLLDQCITHLRESDHIAKPDQSVTLRQSCESLYQNIHDPIFRQLDPPLRDETTFGQLNDNRLSLASIDAAPVNDVQLKREGLNKLLSAIYHTKMPPKLQKGWVDRLVDWFGEKYDEYFKHDNWFTRNFQFGKNLSQSTKRGLVNSLIVVLILMVVFLVTNELRAMGKLRLFKRHKKAIRHDISNTPDSKLPAPLSLKNITYLPIHRQVPALLNYTLTHLINARLLPRRPDLTNREYLEIVRQKLPGAERDFEALVTQSELVVYGEKFLAAGNTGLLFENVRNIVQARDQDES